MARPTMDDVAARAGVSRALVSLVMQESPRVSEHRRQLVLDAAAELGYRPNKWARNLARGRTDTIGVMLNDLTNPFFTEVAQGIAGSATERELQILITSGWSEPDGEGAAIDALVELRTDGLALCGPRLPIDTLMEVAVRTPAVGISLYGKPKNLDTVSNDEAHGATLIAAHLAELGHRRVAHLAAGQAAGGPERRDGLVTACAEVGVEVSVVEGDFDYRSGEQMTSELMEQSIPPTAIVAGNDLVAVGVVARLQTMGLTVPDDVSVVGYDDTLLAGVGTVPLTTVHQPRHELGRRGLELLVERIAGRSETVHETVAPRLVVRASTGPAGKPEGG